MEVPEKLIVLLALGEALIEGVSEMVSVSEMLADGVAV